jgi:hypothetical protein
MLARCVFSLLAAGIVVGARGADTPVEGAPSDRAACENARAAVTILESGSFDERWAALDEERRWLGSISAVAGDRWAACRDKVVADLIRLLRREPDDRIVCRILDLDVDSEKPMLTGFLPDALRHTSPNVRRRALDALAKIPDASAIPEIEVVWQHETRPWLRAAALRALGSAGDTRFLDEFVRVAGGSDPTLSHPAVAALGVLRDPRALKALEELSSDRDLEASDLALETMLQLERTEAVNDALFRVAMKAPSDVGRLIVERFDTGDPEALPWLRGLARARGGDASDPVVADADTAIARIENTDDSNVDTVTFHCGGIVVDVGRSVPLVRTDGDAWPLEKAFAAMPPAGADTSRCWDAPGFVLLSDLHARVPRDESLELADVYEWRGETWRAVMTPERMCWMPAASLVHDDETPDVDSAPPPPRVLAVETDVPSEELAGAASRPLIRLGLATIFDDDDRVAALRIALDPAERETVLTLTRIRALADGQVARGIDRWLWEYGGAWDSDPEIGPFIRHSNPRPRPPLGPDDD